MEIPTFFFIARLIVLASGLFLGASFVLGEGLRSKLAERFRNASRPLFVLAFTVLGILLVAEPTVFSWWQYQAWAADPSSQFLLPPTAPISYFLRYVFLHFWAWRILGGMLALALFLLADRFIIRPSQGFRMNRREAALIAFGVMLAGWPYLLVYFVALLILYVAILSLFTLRARAMLRREAGRSGAQRSPEEWRGPPKGAGLGLGSEGMRGAAEGAEPRETRFPVALPATLALLIIPWAPDIIAALGLTVLRVTVLSV